MKMPLISIVTPNYNDGKFIGDYIESIMDQDWPEIELIIVDDGSTDNSLEVLAKKQKKFKKLKVLKASHEGACAARNLGAEQATGKYISFLPADAVVYPGVIRNWIETLEERPEYDFLYGGYRFVNEDTRQTMIDYISEPFDPYMLKIANYIDGSFPLKKELFDKMGGWDIGIKSLQDWDFWLNAVINHNAKGYYMPEIFFETTYPHQGGLSDDSHRNWLSRTTQIKKKYGIPDKPICVTSKGAEYHAKQVAKILDADYKFSPEFKEHNYDLIYLLGLYPSIADKCGEVFLRHRGLRVVHWIGSDIWQLMQLDTIHKDMLRNWIRHNIDLNITEFQTTHDELKREDIESVILPIPPKKFFPITNLPEKFTIAVYQPITNAEFYFPKLIEEVARKCRNVEFKLFGNPMDVGKRGNVEKLGLLKEAEMEKLINGSSALLRLLVHDGLSINVEEFITAGRRIITNIPHIEGAFNTTLEINEIIKTIKKVQKFKEPDKETARLWLKILDHETYKKFFDNLLKCDPKDYWDKRAKFWNESVKDEVLDKEKVLKEVLALKPKSILDIGCGNGNWANIFVKEGIEYQGIDISDKMVRLANANKKYPEIRFNVGDIRDIKLDKKFDLIFAYTCLLHVPPEDIEKAVANIKKLGKRIIFIEPTKKPPLPEGHRMLPESFVNEKNKGYFITHPKSSFIHDYDKYFKIKKRIDLGERTLFIADL